jgi:VanZ like family
VIADTANRLVTGNLDAGVLVVFVPLLVCAVALSGPTARRIGCRRSLAGLALVALAGILAVTLGVRAVNGGGGFGNASFGWVTDGDLWANSLDTGAGWWLNVALFVPAGVFVSAATRRARWTLVGLIGLSALIEVVQSHGLLGAGDPADLVANSIGAAIGCCLSIPVRRLVFHDEGPGRRSVPFKMVLLSAAGVIAVGGMGWLGVVAGADARRDSLANELREAFAGMTSVEIEAKLDSADGFEEMLSATSVRPGYLGRVGDTDEFEGRWSTEFFGLHRCVFVRWTPTGVAMRDGSGDECTIFRENPPAG